MWGIFDQLEDEIHVIPISDKTYKLRFPHCLSKLCSCQPDLIEPDERGDRPIYSHNELN